MTLTHFPSSCHFLFFLVFDDILGTLYIVLCVPMQPYQLKLTDLYDKLSSSPAGFTTETAKEKLAEY